MKKAENKTFTKDDLKIGHIVKCDGELHMVTCTSDGDMVFVDKTNCYLDLKSYDRNLNRTDNDSGWVITEVYGYSRWPHETRLLCTKNRPLLWKREEPTKKMTIEEIEKELGYKVEIVS